MILWIGEEKMTSAEKKDKFLPSRACGEKRVRGGLKRIKPITRLSTRSHDSLGSSVATNTLRKNELLQKR